MEAAETSEGKKSGKPKASADTPATEAKKLGKAKQTSAETAAAEMLAPFAVDGLPESRTSNEEFNARGNPNHIRTFYVRE